MHIDSRFESEIQWNMSLINTFCLIFILQTMCNFLCFSTHLLFEDLKSFFFWGGRARDSFFLYGEGNASEEWLTVLCFKYDFSI